MEDREKKLFEKIPALAKAKEYGVDIVMLSDNLKRTPAERIRRHQIALETFKKFHNATKRQ